MSLAARSPKPRKSVSGLAEQNLNVYSENDTMPITNREYKATKNRPALFGEESAIPAKQELSPRRQARRSLKPRKSILKGFVTNDDTEDNTQQYAQTLNFSTSRRVSFAPNAHVRMFENPSSKPGPSTEPFPLPPPANTRPRSSISSHSRRSSIQNLNAVATPNVFAPPLFVGEGETQGEESMDIESDSEESEDDEAVEMGSIRRSDDIIASEGNPEDVEDDEDDGDMDMEMTQNVYGGIVRRASMAANDAMDSETDAETSIRSAEEKTMDFTIAVGGLLPPQAPAGAINNRTSIGYSIPLPQGSRNYLPGEAIEGEIEMELEETEAYGGIIGPDDSLSSGSEDTMNGGNREPTMNFTYDQSAFSRQQLDEDGAMEMTVATGGIINLPPVSPAPSNIYPAVSPARPMPTNTRPMSGTPSFARPTASSAQKSRERETATQKRNVFAPSPSPPKSIAVTPAKSGLQVAGEVAKRLSFGSTTSSGGKKRARASDVGSDHGASAKKTRSAPVVDSATEQVFGTPVFQSAPVSRSSLSAPRSSLGTPMRLAQSPARPRVSFMPVERLEEEDIPEPEVEGDGQEEEQAWEQQPVTLSGFLEMTGVQFMEGLPGLNRRRSSVARGVLGQSYGAGDREFALHEYAEARVNNIFLNMYTWAGNKIREDIKTGQIELSNYEAACEENSPAVIQEYLSATDEDKELFEMTFKSFKTNTHLKAKERWYGWKLQLMETIKPDVQNMLEGMQEDHDNLTGMNEQLDALLPELQARQAALQAELAREREIVAEISACDQHELASYKEGIAEQSSQIAGFTSEVEESSAKLAVLTAKLEEFNATKREAVAAISHARSQCDQFTRSDAIRLQEEYVSLQHLHLWRPVKIQAGRLELEFDDEIGLSFECREFTADLDTAKVAYLHDRVLLCKKFGSRMPSKGSSAPTPTPGLFKMLESAVWETVKAGSFPTLPLLVQRIGQLWSTAQRLRAEMHYVNFRHPISYTFLPEYQALKAAVSIVLPSVRSKVVVELEISQEVLWGYPDSLNGTEVAINQVYGKADVALLHEAVNQTISSCTSQGCLGVFLQVCVDIAAQYPMS